MKNTEIERKFLVRGDFKQFAHKSEHIVQGYLSRVPGRTVRVRICDNKGFLTIKGAGFAHFEWEKEIAFGDAKSLLALCEPGIIDKTRYLVADGAHTWEVDEFHGLNSGLLLAEIELSSEDEAFEKPDWLGEEVTGDPRYSNSFLSKNPFSAR